ncbi:MAG: ATP-dependent DNA helicase RecG [Dehalococcoidales bacterium]|nr:ATP-dependent DNA helicase RecG [Dehalococcoidales bacterium]
MSFDAESLRKILKLEADKGYRDSAVIGGLDSFLRNWAGSVAQSITSPTTLKRVRKLSRQGTGYSAMTAAERKECIESILAFVADLERISREEQKPKPAPAPATKQTAVRTAPAKKTETLSLDSPVTVVKGISTTLSARFNKMGMHTVRDLLYYFPNRHIDYSKTKSISQLTEGNVETIVANVWEARETRPGGRRSTEATVGDDTGNVRVVWFNNPYLVKRLTVNTRIIISGKVSLFQGRHVFQSPEWEFAEDKDTVHVGRLVPMYPLTEGLRPRQVRNIMKEVVDRWAWQVEDYLPDEIRERQQLLPLPVALSQAHFPDDEMLKDRTRMRLAFDELFLLQLGVLRKKLDWQVSQPARPILTDRPVLDTFLKSLPFALTGAQQRALREMLADIGRPTAMSRLLQGDVGSGKTVVALAALLMAVAAGFQGALMAPTEILAEQHFSTICNLLAGAGKAETEENYLRTFSGILPRPVTVAMLTGAVNAARKREIHKVIREGIADIAVGTHALIQKDVEFGGLGLAVIDEQHRFGVEQRSALRQKGFNPHIAVMTATPIPRTLALTLYGDLDLSVIDELPPGRQTIKTRWLKPSQRLSAYEFIRKQVAAGRQAFIICPLIEESEAVQARAATIEYERLSREVFPELKLGLLHGKVSASEKEDVMRRFYSGEFDILVATPVVEVGIDVPNATVMMVESADRFGLSQLHQFRGRVGRGSEQSYCMLLAENPSEVARARLDIIENVQDGFKLAEEDLKLRGPGEFYGTRQSGMPDLRMAKISDVGLLEVARSEALILFEKDRNLEHPDHQLLVRAMEKVWLQEAGDVS